MNRAEWEKASGVKFRTVPSYPGVFLVFAWRVSPEHLDQLQTLTDYKVSGPCKKCVFLIKLEDQT